MNQKTVIVILVVVIVILIGTTAYFATINKANQPVAPVQKVVQQPAQPTVPSTDETVGWQTYQNKQYGYQIKYPQGWTVAESDSSGIIGLRMPNKKLQGGDFEADVFITFETSGIQDIINGTGSQFSYRKVSKEDIIIGKNIPAVKLTVSTPSIPDWISHHLLVGAVSGVFDVNDGAQNTPEFWKIASTFEFTR